MTCAIGLEVFAQSRFSGLSSAVLLSWDLQYRLMTATNTISEPGAG